MFNNKKSKRIVLSLLFGTISFILIIFLFLSNLNLKEEIALLKYQKEVYLNENLDYRIKTKGNIIKSQARQFYIELTYLYISDMNYNKANDLMKNMNGRTNGIVFSDFKFTPKSTQKITGKLSKEDCISYTVIDYNNNLELNSDTCSKEGFKIAEYKS